MAKFDYKIDGYGNLTVSTIVDSQDQNCNAIKDYFKMTDLFFTDHCKQNCNGNRTLILNGNYLITEIGRRFENWDVPYLVLFLNNNPNVKTLNLENNKVDSSGFIGLIDHLIVSNNNIKELNLRNNFVGDTGINYLYKNQEKLRLNALLLRGNKIGVENCKKLAITVANNPYVKNLDVAENDQDESSLIYFVTILRSDLNFDNKIKILDISRPNPTHEYAKFNAQHIAEIIGMTLRYNTTLEELHLQKFNFSCHDIEDMLSNAKHNKTLKLLDLRCNNIGNHGVAFISKWLRNCSPLESLLLGCNIITNQGVRELSENVPFSKLTRLDLSYNRFDDKSCSELFYSILKTPNIKKIQIYGNKIGPLTTKIIEKLLKTGTFQQNSIDVKLYQTDGKSFLAFNNFE